MKYSDTGFRAVYHNFTVFPLTDGIRAALKDFPGEEYADSVLTYGYYDGDAGITPEVPAAAKSRGTASRQRADRTTSARRSGPARFTAWNRHFRQPPGGEKTCSERFS